MRLPHAAGQDERADRREHPEPDLGLAEHGLGRGEHALAERGELQPASEALALDGREERLVQRHEFAEQAVEVPQHVADPVRQVLLDARPEREVLARALEEDRSDLGTGAVLRQGAAQRRDHLGVQDVALGTVEL